ncbi:MAG: HEAT repeat domain-containing protein [Planctomycetes bacterium]|nr:HEAT repeat domain-containing protein [Planctomycetota bacterium]
MNSSHARRLLFGGLASVLLIATALGHGGTYQGPGDTVPPGGGGGGGGGGTTPAPSNPAGGGGRGGVPTGGNPAGPGGNSGGPGGRGTGATTGEVAPDLTNWEFWWAFNKSQYLGLRRALYESLSTEDVFGGEGRASTLAPSQAEIRERVVPALRRALETERQNDIVTGALVALGKIGDVRGEDGSSAFVGVFQGWLPDSSQEISETAAVSLGILADENGVRALTELASDSEAGRKRLGKAEVPLRTRAFAAYGLGLVGARSASNTQRMEIVDVLAGVLAAPPLASPDLEVAALTAIGLTPVDWSDTAGLERQRGASSTRAAEVEFVLRYFADESRPKLVRAHAPAALVHLLSHERAPAAEAGALRERIVRELTRRIGEHTREVEVVRQSCVLALGALTDLDSDSADADARAELRRVTDKGQVQERAFALVALGQIAGRPGSGTDSGTALNQLRGLLVQNLGGASLTLRPWAALGLGISERELDELGSSTFTPSPDVRTALRSALHGSSQEVVGAYAVALGIARDREAAGELRVRLREVKAAGQRGYVALGLGMIGAVDAKAEIERIVRDSKYQPELLQQAAIALGLLGDKTLVPELVKMLSEAHSLASQAAVASALGFIGDARSIEPLVAMLQDQRLTGTARGFATVALGIVADKEELPWNAKISIGINYRANTSSLTTTQGTGLLDIL